MTSVPETLKVICCTWNVNSQEPDATSHISYNNNATDSTKIRSPFNNQLINDFRQLLQIETYGEADIYAIGLQEIDMSARAMFKEETEQMWKWEHTLYTVFETTQNKYKQICMIQLVGICLVVFVRREYFKSIKGMRHYIMREGFVGLGNKGSIALRFDLFGRSFCFINMHLAAHTQNLLQRNQSLNSILAKTHFSFGYANNNVDNDGDSPQVKSSIEDEIFVSRADMYVKDHEYVPIFFQLFIVINEYISFTFLFGDFNYRITNDFSNFSFEEIRRKVEDKRWTVLRMCDQLTNEMKRGKILQGYSEGNIDFAPTYKYLPGTNDYACEEAKQKKRDLKYGIVRSEKSYEDVNTGKERIPSWTDRIFYRCNIDGVLINQLYYGRTDSLLSDHKPVSSVFVVPVNTSEGNYAGEEQMRYSSKVNELDGVQKPMRRLLPPPPNYLLKSQTITASTSGITYQDNNFQPNRNSTIISKPQLLSLDDFFSDDDASSSVTPLSETDDGIIHPTTNNDLQLPPHPEQGRPQSQINVQLPPRPLLEDPLVMLPPQPQVSKRSGSRELPDLPTLQSLPQVILPPQPQVFLPSQPQSKQVLVQLPISQQIPSRPMFEDTLPAPLQPVVQPISVVRRQVPPNQHSFAQQPLQQKPPIALRPNMKDMRQSQLQPPSQASQQLNMLPQSSQQFDLFDDENLDWDAALEESSYIKPTKAAIQFYSALPQDTPVQQQSKISPQPYNRSVKGMVQMLNQQQQTAGKPL